MERTGSIEITRQKNSPEKTLHYKPQLYYKGGFKGFEKLDKIVLKGYSCLSDTVVYVCVV